MRHIGSVKQRCARRDAFECYAPPIHYSFAIRYISRHDVFFPYDPERLFFVHHCLHLSPAIFSAHYSLFEITRLSSYFSPAFDVASAFFTRRSAPCPPSSVTLQLCHSARATMLLSASIRRHHRGVTDHAARRCAMRRSAKDTARKRLR